MRISNISELVSIACILIITYSIVGLIDHIKQEFDNPVIEYQYKDFSNRDIEQAMKYHGIISCIIKKNKVLAINRTLIYIVTIT